MPTTTTGIATEFIQFTRTSNATVTDSDGLVKWAPHNILLASESFSSSSWTTANGATVTANSTVAPNGTTTADSVFASAVSLSSSIAQLVSLPIGTAVLSFYVRGGTATGIGAGVFSGSFVSSTTEIVSGPGSASGTGVVTITGLSSSQWTLVRITLSVVTDTTYSVLFYPDNGASSGNSVALWGVSLYRSSLGGMQPNTSAYPLYNPTTPKNLLGYTESLTTGWTNTNTTDAIVSEVNPVGLTGAVDVAATAGNGTLLSSLSLLASPYTFSIWLKRKTGGGTVEITVDGTTYVAAAVTSTWTRFSTTLTPSAGTKTPGIRLVTSGDAVYAWGAQLSDSASLDAYVPAYGAAVTSAAYYGPRRDFNGSTLACNGLLVEEQRSNLQIRSEEFDDSGTWGLISVNAPSANVILSPSGALTGDIFTEDSTTNFHGIQSSLTLTAAAHTYSVYVKQAFGTRNVLLREGVTTGAFAAFNVTSGTVINSGGGGVGTITPVGGSGTGWFRCTMTFTAPAGSNTFQIMLSTGTTFASYAGNGTSGVAVWGAQVELGSFATSYIPTVATTATRTADVASVSTQAFPYSQGVGSLVVNWKVGQTTNPADRLIWLDDTDAGIYDNYISLRQGGASPTAGAQGTVDTSASAAASVVVNTPSLSVGSDYKAAFAFAANDLAFCLNGGTVVTNASATVPSGIDLMRIGGHRDSTYINGHIRQITYLPRRISNAELITRTS